MGVAAGAGGRPAAGWRGGAGAGAEGQDGDRLTSCARMCLFFLIKFLHGSERAFNVHSVTFGTIRSNKSPCFCRFLINSLKFQIRLLAASLQDGYHGPDFL